MNTVLIYIQYFGIALLLLDLACTLYQPPSFNQSMMLFFTTAVLLNTIGYLLELKATDKELALYAVKLIYVGKPYIILSLFLFVLKYCRISYSRTLGIVLFSVHSLIVASVLTCEYHHFFYSSIEFTTEGVYPHLVLGHGWLYNGYMILVVLYSLTMLGCCIHRYRQSKVHAERVNIVYLTIITLIPPISYIIYLFKITGGYDTTAAGYILCCTLLLICYHKYNLLGALSVAKDDVLDNLRDGIVFLNIYSDPLYVNPKAKELYPALSTKNSEDALTDIHSLVIQGKPLIIDNEVYSLYENAVYDQKKKAGTLIKIENITDTYSYTQRLQRDVKEKTKELNQIQHSFITCFANLVEARDGLTGTHIKNTSRYVYLLCRELQKHVAYCDTLTDDYVEMIVDAAPLHDIGKISIPDSILQKPGKLTAEEFEIIKTHSEVGGQIIRQIMDETGDNLKLKTACDMAKYHHERWDGNGYPVGLEGEAIPLCARIMALADVFDALLSKRCYKEPMPKDQALTIIKEGAGTQFDPILTDLFLKINL